MDKHFWEKRWQTNDIAFHYSEVHPALIAHYKELHLKAGDTVFVPLCGKTLDMAWLAKAGLHVIGIELSPIACDAFFQEQGVKPTIQTRGSFMHYQYQRIEILCGDFFALTTQDLPSSIHAVYDCKALVALPAAMRKQYASHLQRVVTIKNAMLVHVFETSDIVQGPPFSISLNEMKELYGEHYVIQLLESSFSGDVPVRLMKKGYKHLLDNVYLLTNKS